jgi:cell division protein ZapD
MGENFKHLRASGPGGASVQKTRMTVYEQPLNERIRAMLRLEYLFERAAYRLDGPTVWDSRASLEAVLDIVALLTRADLKAEIIKELERHAGTLEGLRGNRGVDPLRLDEFLDEIRRPLQALRAVDNVPGSELRQNELLSAVRQRSTIPAGTCSFDVPAYQHWLERPAEERVQQLAVWLGAFDLVREAIGLSLRLIRQSARVSREVAPGGFYQRNIDSSVPYQMIRVVVPASASWFPEISGGRHRFTVRFMGSSSPETRPSQVTEDVDFELQCCAM